MESPPQLWDGWGRDLSDPCFEIPLADTRRQVLTFWIRTCSALAKRIYCDNFFPFTFPTHNAATCSDSDLSIAKLSPPPPPAPHQLARTPRPRHRSSYCIIILALLALLLGIFMRPSPTLLPRLLRTTHLPSIGLSMGLSTSSARTAAAVPMSLPPGAEKATVAAGCFWGVEHMYRKHFGHKGLYDARVGYIGGDTDSPSYRSVCSGTTGHAEATQLVYDPSKISYRQLLEFFYKMHDPTTLNSQGPDRGSQYRSGIFYHDAEQEKVAREVTDKANAQWWSGKIVTQVLPAGQWWDAEAYHQLYLDKNPGGYECPSHFLRNFPDLK